MTSVPISPRPAASDDHLLDVLKGLGSPVWLLGSNGTVTWLNDAARSALKVAPHTLPLTIAAGISDDVLAALNAVPFGVRVNGSVTFHGDRLETIIPCRLCRIDAAAVNANRRAPILVEAVFDIVARREVIRLTEQLAAITDAFPDLRFVMRRDGTIVDVTVANPDHCHRPTEELLLRRAQEVFPEPAAARFAAALARINHGAALADLDYTLTGDRGLRYFEARMVGLPDGIRVMAIVRDVTERRRAEMAAIEGQNALKAALDDSDRGFALFDPQDRLLYCNAAFRAIFGTAVTIAVPGVSYSLLMATAVVQQQFQPAPTVDPDSAVRERLARHRAVVSGAVRYQEVLADGRTILIEERPTQFGGIVLTSQEIGAVPNRPNESRPPVAAPDGFACEGLGRDGLRGEGVHQSCDPAGR